MAVGILAAEAEASLHTEVAHTTVALTAEAGTCSSSSSIRLEAVVGLQTMVTRLAGPPETGHVLLLRAGATAGAAAAQRQTLLQ
jgi:hypothetical protein